ncbi:Uncharacterised protein [Mycobacteroides abscessus]|nr:Uncharacterised protein [Mycobacteroides abscessus]
MPRQTTTTHATANSMPTSPNRIHWSPSTECTSKPDPKRYFST